jgi:hypothetical protein
LLLVFSPVQRFAIEKALSMIDHKIDYKKGRISFYEGLVKITQPDIATKDLTFKADSVVIGIPDIRSMRFPSLRVYKAEFVLIPSDSPSTEDDSPSKGIKIPLSIDSLLLVSCYLDLDDIVISDLTFTGNLVPPALNIDSLSAELIDRGVLKNVSGVVRFDANKPRLEMDVDVISESSHVKGKGFLQYDPIEFDFTAFGDDVSADEIGRMIDVNELSGNGNVKMVFSGSPKTVLVMDTEFDGELFGIDFNKTNTKLTFDNEKKALLFENFKGFVRGIDIDGRGILHIADDLPRYEFSGLVKDANLALLVEDSVLESSLTGYITGKGFGIDTADMDISIYAVLGKSSFWVLILIRRVVE